MNRFYMMMLGVLAFCYSYAQTSNVTLMKGTVSNAEGQPVAGARVVLSLLDDDQAPKLEATTGEDGNYAVVFDAEAFSPIPFEKVRQWPFTAQVSAEGYATHKQGENSYAMIFPERTDSINFILYNTVTYKAREQATLVLPVAPDPDAGAYYELSRFEPSVTSLETHTTTGARLVFTRTMQPQANVPYIFVPAEDYTISLSGLEMTGKPQTVSLGDSVFFSSSYESIEEPELPENYTIQYIDDVPATSESYPCHRILPLHGFVVIKNGYRTAMQLSIVLEDKTNGISARRYAAAPHSSLFDFQGHRLTSKPAKGVYIQQGKKIVIRRR